MLIYRIEHRTGYGLWRACEGYKDYIDDVSFYDELVSLHRNFPTPWEDGINMDENKFCAFKSLQDVLNWIKPEWFPELINLGFSLLEIEIYIFEEGSRQIVFRKENIIISKTIQI